MFGKLMKYEIKDCMRVFLPLWGAMLVLAAINGFTMGIDSIELSPILEFIVHILPILLLFLLAAGMFIVALVLIIRRFYNGLLGEGGYLAFTLPVTVGQHIGSKLLTALIMEAGCVITGLLASLLMLAIRGYSGEIREALAWLLERIPSVENARLLIFEFAVLMLLWVLFTILRLYAGMAIGHLSNTHRGLCSVAAVLLIGWFFSSLPAILAKIGNAFGRIDIQISIESAEDMLYRLPRFFGAGILFLLIGCAALWAVTHLILRKKLNIL